MKKLILILSLFLIFACKQENQNADNTKQTARPYKDFASFKSELDSQPDKIHLIDLYADWCVPCQFLSPILEKTSEKYSKDVILTKVNIDMEPAIREHFKVRGIPMVIFYYQGRWRDTILGVKDQNTYNNIIETLLQNKG